MKYPQIAANLNWAETPDCAEGLFLQPEEADTLEASLANAASAADTAATTITELQGQVQTATEATEAVNATLATTQEELIAANTRIEALEAENATLKVADGPVTSTVETKAADTFETTEKVSAMDMSFQKELMSQV